MQLSPKGSLKPNTLLYPNKKYGASKQLAFKLEPLLFLPKKKCLYKHGRKKKDFCGAANLWTVLRISVKPFPVFNRKFTFFGNFNGKVPVTIAKLPKKGKRLELNIVLNACTCLNNLNIITCPTSTTY